MSAWRKLGIRLEIETSEDDKGIANELMNKLVELSGDFCKKYHISKYDIGHSVTTAKETLETKWRQGELEKQIIPTICKAVTIYHERSSVVIYVGCTPFNEDAVMKNETVGVAKRICKALNNVG